MENILCLAGLHKWEKEPQQKEIMHGGVTIALFIHYCPQRGIKRCLRKGCMKSKMVWRSVALTRIDGLRSCEPRNKWRRPNKEQLKAMNSLKVWKGVGLHEESK